MELATPVKEFIFTYNPESDKRIYEIFTDVIAEKIYNSAEVQSILKNNKKN